MPNRGHNRLDCRVCGRLRAPDERFSARGKCPDCGDGRMLDNVHQLRAHEGPRFRDWRRACAAALGAVLLDDREGGQHTDEA